MIELSPGPIEYLVHTGDPGLNPLVFLHEGLGSAGMWGKLPRLLAARTGRSTVVYSRSGYGGSGPARLPRERGYLHTEARVLRELLGELEIDNPILVGHSDGASIAILYAGSAEVSADALVLIAPHVIVEEVTLAGIRTAVDRFADGSLARKLAQFHNDPERVFRGWTDIWLSPGFRDWDIRPALPGVSCPVLVIQGDADQYGTTAQLDAIEHGAAGIVRRLELPETGHSPHLEQPVTIAEAITDFLGRRG